MTWLAIVSTALQIIAAAVGYLQSKQQIEAGTAEAIAAHLRGAIDEVQRAQTVRDRVRSSFSPDRLPSDDPNLRD